MFGSFLPLKRYIHNSEAITRLSGAVLTLLFLQGCVGYQPKPLSTAAVAIALTPPSEKSLQIQAGQIHHPILKPVEIDFRDGLSADEAAIVAVIANPSLRAERDKRGVAAAQLLQAGILPNPTLSYSLDVPTGGNTQGTVTAYGLSADWALTDLITRTAKIAAARAQSASVDLDIAWKEWQVAESARQQVYRVLYLERELSIARAEEEKLDDNLCAIRKAVSLGDMTILDEEAAEASYRKARASDLDISGQLQQERLTLKSLLGLPPQHSISLQKDISPPSPEHFPPLETLLQGLEDRRLDLLGLKMGYKSEEEKVRVAIAGQFPQISIGPSFSRDNTDVKSTGFSISIDLPFFDRNQGKIAIAKATRHQLFDEYVNRVFEARADTASILAQMKSIEKQIDAGEQTVESLRKLARTSYNGFLEGNISALDYYNELDNLFTKQIEVLKLRQSLADHTIALEITVGEYLGRTAEEKVGGR